MSSGTFTFCDKMLPQVWEDKLQDGSSLYFVPFQLVSSSFLKSVAFDCKELKKSDFHGCINAIKCSPKPGRRNCRIIIAPVCREQLPRKCSCTWLCRHLLYFSQSLTVFLSLTNCISLSHKLYFSHSQTAFLSVTNCISLTHKLHFSHSQTMIYDL